MSNLVNYIRERFFPDDNPSQYGDGTFYTMFGGPPLHFHVAAAARNSNGTETAPVAPVSTDYKIKKSIVIDQECHLLKHTVNIGSRKAFWKNSELRSLPSSEALDNDETIQQIDELKEDLKYGSSLKFASHLDLEFYLTFELIFSDKVKSVEFTLLTDPAEMKDESTGGLSLTNEKYKITWSSHLVQDIGEKFDKPSSSTTTQKTLSTISPLFTLSSGLLKKLAASQGLDWKQVMKNKDPNHKTFPVPLILRMSSTLHNGDIHHEYTRIQLSLNRAKKKKKEDETTPQEESEKLKTTKSSFYLLTVDASADQTIEQPILIGNNKAIHLFNFSPIYSGSDDQNRLCAICLEAMANVVTLPCKHMHLCSECANYIRENNEKCPLCRSVIDAFVPMDPQMTPEIFMAPPTEQEVDDHQHMEV